MSKETNAEQDNFWKRVENLTKIVSRSQTVNCSNTQREILCWHSESESVCTL